MTKKILECTNIYGQTLENNFLFDRDEIIAFIGILFCRGLFCPGSTFKAIWSKKYGVNIVTDFMSLKMPINKKKLSNFYKKLFI